MKKIYKIYRLLCVLFLFSASLFAQDFKFAWITDLHIGYTGADENLSHVVADINSKHFPFVLVTGDIGEKGRNSELEEAKQILDSLNTKYYMIPGNHDTKWSESGCTKFSELWGDDKFNFVYNGVHFIGLNSGVILRGGGGHIVPEDLEWIDTVLSKINKSDPVIIITHHPLNGDVDNWFKLINKFKEYNVVALFNGHGHSFLQSEIAGLPALMCRSTLNDKEGKWGYGSVEINKDSVFMFEERGDSVSKKVAAFAKNVKREKVITDSLQFINYGVKEIATVRLNKTISAQICTADSTVYAAAVDGTVYCISSEGKIVWSYSTGGNIVGKPVRVNDELLVGTIQGDLIALNSETGKVIQTMGVNDGITSQLITSRLITENDTLDVVFAGTAGGNLICCETGSLQEVWRNEDAKGMIETEPLIVNNRIIYGSWDSYLYCLELSTGRINWRYSGNANFYYSPAACKPVTDGKYIYITTPDKYVTAVDILLGKAKWRKKEAECWESTGISRDKKNLLIKGFTDKFYIVSTKDGKVVKNINCRFGLDTMPTEAFESDGVIYFTAKNGKVYSIGKNSTVKELAFLGTARLLSLRKLDNSNFAAASMDGTVFIFSIGE